MSGLTGDDRAWVDELRATVDGFTAATSVSPPDVRRLLRIVGDLDEVVREQDAVIDDLSGRIADDPGPCPWCGEWPDDVPEGRPVEDVMTGGYL